ncbi:MAG TPA: glutaminyl-peptide cyclotransferase [Vicinamibacterales bacterium]|nr:glutaminyl-peptide cyclotransferase [Vicinamibacterales bacterium]
MRGTAIIIGLTMLACAPATVAQRRPAPVQSYKVIATFPHDTSSFTQGLVFASDGQLYESTGLEGESTLRRVDIATGQTLQRIDVPSRYFAEGLALVGDELLQLTWRHKLGFVYDRNTFKQKRTFSYNTEGWGIAYDGTSSLVMSDGSDTLSFLDPKSLAITKTLRVMDAGRPVSNLNELEWIEGEIWANIWMTDRIARISPNTGEVNAWIDLSSLYPASQRVPPADVLNGIAYDKATRRIYITGKKWPRLYQISVF